MFILVLATTEMLAISSPAFDRRRVHSPDDHPFPRADQRRLLPYVANLELEVDRLQRHNRLVHRELRRGLDHIRELCQVAAGNAPPGPEGAPRRLSSRAGGINLRLFVFIVNRPANARAGATDAERETVEGPPSPSFFFLGLAETRRPD